ncbi:MAG: hypothetical protein O7C56_10010 [Rickettsia endosymbiont of Ixodes persulcatus]|nr:hypothetical protein [Rickettsia endosymbiont of Ixodes persulcatus]
MLWFPVSFCVVFIFFSKVEKLIKNDPNSLILRMGFLIIILYIFVVVIYMYIMSKNKSIKKFMFFLIQLLFLVFTYIFLQMKKLSSAERDLLIMGIFYTSIYFSWFIESLTYSIYSKVKDMENEEYKIFITGFIGLIGTVLAATIGLFK